MILEMLHPEVARRSCEDCCAYEYNHKTGERVERGSPRQPVRRPTKGPGRLPPCLSGIQCAKGTIHATNELSEKNQTAYSHYLRCKATGHFPDDPVVAQNAAIIREIEEAISDGRERAVSRSMASMARFLGG